MYTAHQLPVFSMSAHRDVLL